MKYTLLITVFCFLFVSCKKEDRTTGICYCTYFKGDPKQYDLRDMTREEQVDQCSTHDSNAAKFGGKCELE